MARCTLLFLLFLFSNILTVYTSNNGFLSFSTSGVGYFVPNPSNCTSLLNNFAESASRFTLCSIKSARPIQLCEKCIDEYLDFQNKYDEMLKTVVNGTSCKSIFISHDRLDAVLDYYNNIMSVWNKGHCKACYDWSNSIPVLSNETIHFKTVCQETKNCIDTNFNPAHNNSEEVCGKCKQAYEILDNYYKTLSSDSIGLDSVCMDIVDSMNATRSYWSKVLNCCQMRRSPEIIFLCCTAVISVLPLLYYLVLRYFGPIRDLPNVLRQTRFKQTFLRSDSGRSN